ncbi:MAG TPA: type VI secretion system baseplate subunit TssK [Blastocatellia bacterium]|nr:type VI secretion system baseplate subunit TssK [Blastocatellia bacterium]
MSRYRKILWDEGMLLTPHHFQQWDNYHEELLNARLSSLAPYEWGILDLQVNREAVANGFFELLRCNAVMPDGLLVSIPQTDPAPSARPVEGHFDPAADRLDVHLAVPARRVGAINFQLNGSDGGAMVRYALDAGAMPDETTGDNERQIGYARGNLRLLFGDEMREGYSSIKIAELERTPTGQLTLSENWIPPALNVGASTWLVNLLRQLVEILITKSGTLSEQRRQRAPSLADLTTSEVAVFWLLHTVNSAIPHLAHLFRTRVVHPERLYTRMAELAGELMTFVSERHPKDIVRYDHTDLYTTFSQLGAEIRELLETVIPTRCVAIPLENVRKSLYLGRVLDEQLLKEATFFLGARAQMPEGRLIELVPRIIKIAARDVIDAVVASALPGVTLTHASPAPAPIPVRVGFHYFGLDSVGPYWDTIRGSKTIAIYVPDEFPDVKLELYAIKP